MVESLEDVILVIRIREYFIRLVEKCQVDFSRKIKEKIDRGYMIEKVGRNDPCPCGSGKKYKSCCFLKQQQKKSSLGGRKFTAKVLSAGGVNKPKPEAHEEQARPAVDYSMLMERSFGTALHSHEEKPPLPSNPSEYLAQDESNESSK